MDTAIQKKIVVRKLIIFLSALFMLFLFVPGTATEAATAKISASKKTLTKGQSFTLKVKNYKGSVEWSSEKPKIASVDSSGTVTALKKGKTFIYATTEDGTVYKCKVTVKKAATPQNGDNSKVPDTSKTPEESGTADTTQSPEGTGTSETEQTPEKAGETDTSKNPAETNGTDAEQVSEDITQTPATEQKTEFSEDSYGILNPQKKTEYRSTYTYEGVISTEEELIAFTREALENGAETISFTYSGSYQTWWSTFNSLAGRYSILSGYANQYNATIRGNTLIIYPTYKDAWKAVTLLRHTGYSADSTTKAILNKCNTLVNEAMENSSDVVEILKYINQALVDMAEYDDAGAASNAIIGADGKVVRFRDASGVLFDGLGVCESYTAAFRVCLDILGIENQVITNKAANHVWNRALINGKWYHFDVTWNDGCQNRYFMLTDSELAETDQKLFGSITDHEWYKDYVN